MGPSNHDDPGISAAEAAVFAHDLKNLLATTLGHAEIQVRVLAEKGAPGPDLGASLEAIRLTTGRAVDLCEDLLALSRGRTGDRESLELGGVAAAAQALFESRCSGPARCRLSGAPGVRVRGRRLDLERALLNLLWNAREAALSAGVAEPEILVSWGKAPYGNWLEIRDNGPGFPDGHLGGLQEAYRSTKISEGAGEVRGLGLHAAAEIMRRHGGRLSGRNAPAGGAIMRLDFGLERELDFGSESAGGAATDSGP